MIETANPPWLARLETDEGTILGSGFLASTDTFVTCAHVLEPAPTAGAPVTLQARFVHAIDAPAVPVEFHSDAFHPLDGTHAGMDLAVGTLESAPPQGARPTKLFDSLSLAGHDLMVKGFPAGADWGDTVAATAVAEGGPHPGWWEIHPRCDRGSWIERGFSGAPVWSETIGAVVAMAVARAGNGTDREAYAIPIGGLVEAHPELGMIVQLDLDYEHAEAQLRRRVRDLETAGCATERIAAAHYALAVMLIREQKNLDEAERLISLAWDARHSGSAPASAITLHTALGNVRLLQGRNDDAIASFSEAVDAADSLAADDPRRAPSLNGRGVANTNLGNIDSALDDLQRARDIEERAFGASHFNLSTVFQNLANVFMLTGRTEEAEDLAERAHKIELATNGEGHPRTAIAARSLAGVLASRGAATRARALLSGAEAVIGKSFSGAPLEMAKTTAAIGELDLADGNHERAFERFSNALAIIESTLGHEHPAAASAIAAQAHALAMRNEPLRAAEFLDRAIDLAERSNAAPTERARLYELRRSMRLVTDRDGALADAERAVELLRQHPNQRLGEITSFTILAHTNFHIQRLDEAEKLARQGLGRLGRSTGPEALSEATLRAVLGSCLAHTGQLDEAEQELREALRLVEIWGGARNAGPGHMYMDLGTLLRAKHQKAQSERAHLRGLEILSQNYPAGHPMLKQAKLRAGVKVWIKHLAQQRARR